jgi:Peptidase family S41/N-terminal domain of Peptidase_S41 in eukaryotic IRBP
MGGAVEQADVDRIQRVINHEVRERFPDGAVQRAVLLQHGDDPAIEPGMLLVRVLIPAPAGGEDYEAALAGWEQAHRTGMDSMRRELSLRLPSARLLEFTFEDGGADMPRLTVPDDGSLAGEQLSGREIVTRALELLRANYVFPELAERAATAIEARLAAGEYDNLDEITLTELVTRQLREVCDDKHLALRLGGGPPGPAPGAGVPGPGVPGPGVPGPEVPGPAVPGRGPEARRAEMRNRGRLDNFGIRRVERLDGNVGYLDVHRIAMPANAGPAIAAAMELVAGTYALIIDLRRNGGGAVDGVVFWCSYLFDERPTHLNDIFHADTGETRQFWALPYVPGSRYTDKPVYVLSSSHTFSGGEDFCYTLQALGRATVIGETTGGGAHPTRPFPISPAVHIAVPFARSVNPVTGTNWQGTGVVPDVAVPEDQARDVAYARALRHVLGLDELPPPIEHEARGALAALPAEAATVEEGVAEA